MWKLSGLEISTKVKRYVVVNWSHYDLKMLIYLSKRTKILWILLRLSNRYQWVFLYLYCYLNYIVLSTSSSIYRWWLQNVFHACPFNYIYRGICLDGPNLMSDNLWSNPMAVYCTYKRNKIIFYYVSTKNKQHTF